MLKQESFLNGVELGIPLRGRPWTRSLFQFFDQGREVIELNYFGQQKSDKFFLLQK